MIFVRETHHFRVHPHLLEKPLTSPELEKVVKLPKAAERSQPPFTARVMAWRDAGYHVVCSIDVTYHILCNDSRWCCICFIVFF